MNLDVYEFGKGEHPDKAFGKIIPSDFEDGPKSGAGLCVSSLNTPDDHNYGDGSIDGDKCTPIFGMWFFREESVDALIKKLMEIKTEIINQHLKN